MQIISKRYVFFWQSHFSLERQCNNINTHNCRISGRENLELVIELEIENPKLNVRCGLILNEITRSYLFVDSSIDRFVYLDILELFRPSIGKTTINTNRSSSRCSLSLGFMIVWETTLMLLSRSAELAVTTQKMATTFPRLNASAFIFMGIC